MHCINVSRRQRSNIFSYLNVFHLILFIINGLLWIIIISCNFQCVIQHSSFGHFMSTHTILIGTIVLCQVKCLTKPSMHSNSASFSHYKYLYTLSLQMYWCKTAMALIQSFDGLTQQLYVLNIAHLITKIDDNHQVKREIFSILHNLFLLLHMKIVY